MKDFDAKVKLLKDFDERHKGTYTINDLSELILEAYELGIERLCELRNRIYDMPTTEFGKYWLMDEFEKVLYGDKE